MDDKTVMIGAIILGAVVVVLMVRGGSGGSTMQPLPSGGGSVDRTQAFSSLVDLAREEIDANRDLALGKIQGQVENNRIAAAERASIEESQTQVQLANIQASTQTSSSFFDFLGNVAQVALPFALA